MDEEKFEWTCPRSGCNRVIMAYTERGVRLLADEHVYQHMREDREAKVKSESKPAPPPMTTAMVVFKPRDYDKLVLTRIDLGFLKTRGIKLDDNIVLDKGDNDGDK